MAAGDDDDLPEPEIETIRNLAGLAREIQSGALLTLDGEGVHGSAVDVGVLSEVLGHFQRLFRILQVHLSGFDVRRTGRLLEVPGGRRLTAIPAVTGSYAIPLRLELPDGHLLAEDVGEFNALMALLSGTADDSFLLGLDRYPERVGDELYWLLRALDVGHVDLEVQAIRDGKASDAARVDSRQAKRRSSSLIELITSPVGTDILRGKLFRIDTRRSRIAIDVTQDTDESTTLEEATFRPDQLEALRAALNYEVEVTVEVLEQRRPYERSARSSVMAVMSVSPRLVDSDT